MKDGRATVVERVARDARPAEPGPPRGAGAAIPRFGPFRRADVLAAAAGLFRITCWMVPWLAPGIALWSVLLFVAVAPVRSAREAARAGAIFGIVEYALAAHFLLALMRFSLLGASVYLLSLLYIAPFTAAVLAFAVWLEQRAGVRREVGLVLLFPLAEKLHEVGPFSLPAVVTAHAFGGAPAWLSWSRWIGPFGIALWAGVVSYLLWTALRSRRRLTTAAFAAAAALLWIAPPLTAWLAPAPVPAPATPFRAAIVQPALTLAQKLNPRFAPEIWATLEQMTKESAPGTDLVVWGETIRPGPVFWREGQPFRDPEVEAIARAAGVPILYGCEIARVDPAGRRVTALYNGAALARHDGTPGAWYGKQQLVPFVEGVPFAELIGYDPAKKTAGERSWFRLTGNFSPGPEAPVFQVGAARIGVLICYEGLYPALARQYGREGANLLAILVNDTWWGRTYFPAWHARMPAARAAELGVPVVRATNDGISGATTARGASAGRTGLGEATTLVTQVDLGSGQPTLYARAGDWILWLDLLVLAGLTARGLRRRRRV